MKTFLMRFTRNQIIGSLIILAFIGAFLLFRVIFSRV